MANVKVFNMSGSEVGSIELNDSIFAVEVNTHVMHQAVVQYLANKRQGTQSALTRAEVRGGGRKPWRQKGTGRADRVQHVHHSGLAVVLYSLQSQEITLSSLTRRLRD